jgi:hypothetical protein
MIVLVEETQQCGGPLGGMVVGFGISPFLQGGLDEAFGFPFLGV